ncbi:kelch repeat and BTB domain-containing protein 3, partial [Biomphalaria pfeifferi]
TITSCFDISSNKISQGIISSIAELGRKGKFEDFEVIVEGERIKCHSFLLASCSEFFRNLLDSNMKEKQDMKVNLPNVTSKTFKLILNSLYTGELLLTNDNVLDVWAAVHQLQIDFLVQHCEDFIVVNVTTETFQAYEKQADVLQCQSFTERVFPFLYQNFMTLRKSLTF